MKIGVPARDHRAGIGLPLGDAAAERRRDLRSPDLLLGDRELASRLRVRRLGHLHRDLRRQVVLVGDAAGLQQAVRAILLRPRVRAIGLGDVELRLRAIAREPEVGVVQHGEQLTARHAIAFVPEHALEARRHFRHDGDFGARIERAGQRQCLRQIARLARSPCAPECCAPFRPRRRRFCLGPAARSSAGAQPAMQRSVDECEDVVCIVSLLSALCSQPFCVSSSVERSLPITNRSDGARIRVRVQRLIADVLGLPQRLLRVDDVELRGGARACSSPRSSRSRAAPA